MAGTNGKVSRRKSILEACHQLLQHAYLAKEMLLLIPLAYLHTIDAQITLSINIVFLGEDMRLFVTVLSMNINF